MSELPNGVSYQDLQEVLMYANGGCTIPQAISLAGIDSDVEKIIGNKTAYWFLFDNLNRQSAQELWVYSWKQDRDRVNTRDPFMPYERR